MGIEYECYWCKNEPEEFGALLFSPPETGANGERIEKYHLCPECYDALMGIMGAGPI